MLALLLVLLMLAVMLLTNSVNNTLAAATASLTTLLTPYHTTSDEYHVRVFLRAAAKLPLFMLLLSAWLTAASGPTATAFYIIFATIFYTTITSNGFLTRVIASSQNAMAMTALLLQLNGWRGFTWNCNSLLQLPATVSDQVNCC